MRHQPALTAIAVATTHGINALGRDGLTALSGPDAALVALADTAPSSRIVVMLPGALDLACALMHLGCTDVTMIRLTDRPRAGQADIVIVPQVACPDILGKAVPFARRILAPLGTVVVRLDDDMPAAAAHAACQQFQALGFAAVRQRVVCGATLLRAELPLFGLRQCA